MSDRQLMQQAMKAMLNFPNDISDEMFESIRALRARLAQPEQPEQEPVIGKWSLREVYFDEDGEPISYRSPPQRKPWVGLTDEEKSELDAEYGDDTLAHLDAIEAKLKEKNT